MKSGFWKDLCFGFSEEEYPGLEFPSLARYGLSESPLSLERYGLRSESLSEPVFLDRVGLEKEEPDLAGPFLPKPEEGDFLGDGFLEFNA
ncbi:hypothetical protein LPTSP1_15960 [Leptospira johnsonii]|uniref:Uncharacterized protein n=1 Tax=Leptospira johnsonii TaxID=1917820 RepID=A0A2P2D1T9_9LEPT|nr:hypothetical protein LPTSP1_15960 [Leptospira johnsonii]